MANFDTALAWLLEDEGGFINDPCDPGGATNLGITIASLAEWRGRSSAGEVEALTLTDARCFYREMYWAPLALSHCTSDAAATCILDLSVLVGRRRGIMAAQRASGAKQDGVMGAATLLAINATPEGHFVTEMTIAIASLLIRRTEESPPMSKFLAGWMTRCFRLFRLAVQPGHSYSPR